MSPFLLHKICIAICSVFVVPEKPLNCFINLVNFILEKVYHHCHTWTNSEPMKVFAITILPYSGSNLFAQLLHTVFKLLVKGFHTNVVIFEESRKKYFVLGPY